MLGSSSASHLPEKSQAIESAKSVALHPDSILHPSSPLQTRNRVRKRRLLQSRTSRRTNGAFASGKRRGPGTPLLRWKFEDDDHSCPFSFKAGGNKTRKAIGALRIAKKGISARKIAAGIWHLQLREGTWRGGGARQATCTSPGLEFARTNNPNLHYKMKGLLRSASMHKSASSLLPDHAMETAPKWDADRPKISEEFSEMFSQLKLLEGLEGQQVSVISSLRAELEWSQSRIHELEAERQSVKKTLDRFLIKLGEEKTSWRIKEHEKVRAVIDSINGDLRMERKNRQRGEIVNSKLLNELADAKQSANRLFQDFEKERKAREIMEEVFDALAKEIGEDKAEVENLRRDSMKIREEVEDERNMLQMAEVWREERVQMKLVDAKLALEDKYSKLSKLQTELEGFLRVWTGASPDNAHVRHAEILKEALELAKMEEINEFTYQPPPASEDIFAVFEEFYQNAAINERGTEPNYAYSRHTSHDSNVLSASPATDVFLQKQRHSNKDTEDESDWETLSPDEELELCRGSEPSVHVRCEENYASVSRNRNNCKVNGESCEIYTLATGQAKKGASIGRLWRSSCTNNKEFLKKSSLELLNGRISDGRLSNLAASPNCNVGEVGFSPQKADQWSSPDSLNRHIARGMKGCIEWPSLKHSLKAKLLEVRMDSHKTQLRHVLKQKI